MIETVPKNLTTVLDAIVLYGGKPIVVGGSLRDYFFNIPCSDYDIEVYGITTFEMLENILKNFGTVNFVGKSFGILKLSIEGVVYDFSFPRTENKIGLGHKEFAVTIDSSLSFQEASQRRDFTINAIGYDYIKKEFLDPYNGIKDIKNKLLKHIDDKSFIEDPLRVYRAVQFCGRFELTLNSKTKKLCINIVQSEEFHTVSKERVFDEYEKLLLHSKKPSLGLKILTQMNIIKISNESIANIDAMVHYKTQNHKDDRVLMFYFLFDILRGISEEKSLLKTIQKLQKFQVPKIFENRVINSGSEAQLVFIKYQ